jgi:hypothetical protein
LAVSFAELVLKAVSTQVKAGAEPDVTPARRFGGFLQEPFPLLTPVEQLPLGAGDLGDQTALIGGLGLPCQQEPFADFEQLPPAFGGQISDMGTQSVAKPVEADESPSRGVLGPVDFFALRRLAAICFLVAIGCFSGSLGSLVFAIRLHEGALIVGLAQREPVKEGDLAGRAARGGLAENSRFGSVPVVT